MIKSKSTKIGDAVIVLICVFIIITCLLPLLNILARSLSDPQAVMRSQVGLWPKGLNIEAYKLVFTDAKYTRSLGWTAILTVIFTLTAMIMTTLCAYPLIYEKLKGRRFFNTIMIFTR
jgi:putative aldouronate transport system permease protein